MSPSPAAPSRASITACVSASASEWPTSPLSCSTSMPPSTSFSPSARRCESQPIPARVLNGRDRSPERLHAALAALVHRDLGHPDLLEHLHGVLVAVGELVRLLGVRGERDGP